METSIPALTEQNMTLERLNSLYEFIARMNSEHELQPLLEFVIDRALNLTGGQRGLLLLSDDYDRTLQHIAVVQGKNISQQHMEEALNFVSTTVIKDVLEQAEPRIVTDLQVDQRYGNKASNATLQFKKVRSVMAVPLKVVDQLVGLIYIDHPKQATFGQAELEFLSAFANQAAIAINRTQQHQRKIDELTHLNKLSQSVVQVLDLNDVMARIVLEAMQIINAENGSVMLLDEAKEVLTFAVSMANGQQVDIPMSVPKDKGIAGWVVTNGEPACISNVAQDSRWFGEVQSDFVTRSLLCVPLQHNKRVLGVLQVLNKQGSQEFTQSDIALLSAFATSATIAIENARLFEEARQVRLLRALNETALKLSATLDFETILSTGLEQAVQVLKAEAGAISLNDNPSQSEGLAVQSSYGLTEDYNQLHQQEQIIATLSNQVLQQGENKPFIINHLNQHPSSTLLFEAGFKALAFVPIKVGGKTNGILTIMKKLDTSYNSEETNLLTGITQIIGLALQNAIQHKKIQDQAAHLTNLNEIGSLLTRNLDLDQVLRLFIEVVNTGLETERTSVFLIDPETNELVLSYTNEGDANIRLPLPWQGIAGWVATNDAPALVNDTLADPRHLRKIALETDYEAHSILCVPLKIEGQVLGVIEVLNKTDGQPFTHQHQALLIEFSRWASIALHNARLFHERIRAYRSLADEQDKRIAAETRGAMADIILNMAHNMNNVVGAIRVWIKKLENAIQVTPQRPVVDFTREIKRIQRNTEETIELISNMKAPLEKVAVAPTDVHHCLDAAIAHCFWPDNIQYQREYTPNLPPVRANTNRLEAVFHNVISNAIHALTQIGGNIVIKTILTHHKKIEITITDDGPGIPPELLDMIFKPGFSGKEGGLGIGLWLAETFIHQFDGQITCTTPAQSGTKFTITLQPLTIYDL